MKLRFKLTVDDLIAAVEHTHGRPVKRTRWLTVMGRLCFIVGAVALGSILMGDSITGSSSGIIIAWWVLGGCALGVLAWYCLTAEAPSREAIETYAKNAGAGVQFEKTYTLTEEGIRADIEDQAIIQKWSGFQNLTETDTHVFLHLKQGGKQVVAFPKRVFEDENQQLSFVERVRSELGLINGASSSSGSDAITTPDQV